MQKVAMISGASRGIGRAIAFALADAGADVAVASRGRDEVKLLAAELEARGVRALAAFGPVVRADTGVEGVAHRSSGGVAGRREEFFGIEA